MSSECGASSGSTSAKMGESSSSSKKLRALIVDNHETYCKIHEDLLEKKFNMKTDTCLNGKEAVCFVRSGETFDIIFLDQEMPILDGPQTAEGLRGMGVKCPIIGLYEYSTKAEIERFMKAGLDDCLPKPLTEAMVKDIIENL